MAIVDSGFVKGIFEKVSNDGIDGGVLPDVRRARGRVFFHPVTPVETHNGTTIRINEVFVGHIDKQGRLVDRNRRDGLWLPVGTYNVVYDIDIFPIEAHSLPVTLEDTPEDPIWLAEELPPQAGEPLTNSQYQELLNMIEGIEVGEGGGPTTWGDVTEKPTSFTPSAHTHTESEITDLGDYATTSELNLGLQGKADSTHTHGQSDITGLSTALTSRLQAVIVTTGAESRPSGSDVVCWIGGSTQPTNMAENDLWFREEV